MVKLPTRLLEALESLRPGVRRQRRQYAAAAERIDEQAVADGAFRCERCERVQSRHAVGGLAEMTSRREVWCLDCVEHREEVAGRAERARGFGAVRRE